MHLNLCFFLSTYEKMGKLIKNKQWGKINNTTDIGRCLDLDYWSISTWQPISSFTGLSLVYDRVVKCNYFL